eukprot:TRINITY_DN4112_c0_g1_i1.p6 TRINITY_DN4112_c0_g1~~TRINITY_DN4112_c0_g1_i1.p6  ORF type:complete len:100 (-),score=3.08 TRINITY_DN4112_c0_g1_i1:1296-1595(-)
MKAGVCMMHTTHPARQQAEKGRHAGGTPSAKSGGIGPPPSAQCGPVEVGLNTTGSSSNTTPLRFFFGGVSLFLQRFCPLHRKRNAPMPYNNLFGAICSS